jgi:hypothetical protein
MRNAYKILVRKSDGKRPLGRARLRWEDCIRMDLTDKVSEGVDCIHLAQDREEPVASSCENGTKPSGYIRGGDFFDELLDS